MSSFVWMKVLESAPERYDRGMRMLMGGRIGAIHERLADLVAAPGKRVLDIGCGTGGVSFACAACGAIVTGIDVNAGMLDVARNKPAPSQGSVTFVELGAAEIGDQFPENAFDGVAACLLMSELSPQEQDYVLRLAFSRLAPGGVIAIADETVPQGALARLTHALVRLPVAATAYLLTQATTRPTTTGLAQKLRQAGFGDVAEEWIWPDFLILHAKKMKT